MSNLTAGIGDPYWYEWLVGVNYALDMLSPDTDVAYVILLLIKRFNYPISSCDTGDYFVGQRTNRIAEAVHDLCQTCKDLVSEAALTDFFPNLLDRIHLRRVWRNVEQFDVLRDFQCGGFVPCCAIAAQKNDVIRVRLG